ncbi:MAG: diguanylate cyclase, partial [Candidatus Omnitrophica bacterium]|nr:diguanylate cyclase [Candidatus Omnitrophota bacterium]
MDKVKEKKTTTVFSVRRVYKLDKLDSIMTKSIITISPDSDVTKAVALMCDNGISCLVVTRNGSPAGIITERDIVKMVADKESFDKPVSEKMSNPLVTATPKTSLNKALDVMRTNHIRRLPVVENGLLAGLVTESDLLVASRRAMMDIRQEHRKVEKLAIEDKLTGLYNRHYFNKVMKKELERVKRYGGLLSLILIDIDHFKRVNDSFGHVTGDIVLKKLSRIFKDSARKIDVVFRYGGEEFAVVCPISGTRSSRIFARRLRRSVEKTRFKYKGTEFGVTISAGICKYTSKYSSIKKIITAADKAL